MDAMVRIISYYFNVYALLLNCALKLHSYRQYKMKQNIKK